MSKTDDNHGIKVVYSTPHKIIFNMGKKFNNIEIIFACEEMPNENKVEIYSKSLKANNIDVIISNELRNQIIEAITQWNSNINALVFV